MTNCDLELGVGAAVTDKKSRVGVTEDVIQRQIILSDQNVLRPFALLLVLPCRNYTDVPTTTCTPRDALARCPWSRNLIWCRAES